MRNAVLILCMCLSGCGLKRMLPEGPVLDDEQRASFAESSSGAAYSGERLVELPVLPVLAWAVPYDLDLVVVSKHPEWNMHEYARLQTPEGPVWLAKDARESTMEQSIVADVPAIEEWFPELPVQRRSAPVEVIDNSTEDWLDLQIRYTNVDGKPVEIRYEGKPPRTRLKKRNGSTMGHSRDLLMAVLDLPQRNFGRRTSVLIDGEAVAVSRLLGLVPFRMALVQTQGGLASGELRMEPSLDELQVPEDAAWATPGEQRELLEAMEVSGGFDTVHYQPGGQMVRRSWEVRAAEAGLEVRQVSPLRTLVYTFREGERGTRELASAHVESFGAEQPTMRVSFSPAIPDLGHRFHGTVEGRFVIDMNDQPAHAVGRFEARWTEDGPELSLVPEAPWWVADRPLLARFVYEEGGVNAQIVVDRADEAAAGADSTPLAAGE